MGPNNLQFAVTQGWLKALVKGADTDFNTGQPLLRGGLESGHFDHRENVAVRLNLPGHGRPRQDKQGQHR
jgi:hypothetical protein